MAEVVVYRPRRLRAVVVVSAVVLGAATALGWLALPGEIRVLFTLSQRITLVGFGALLVAVIAAVAASSVRADDSGLQIRNGLNTTTVGWNRVHKILLRPGDPWALLLLRPLEDRTASTQVDPAAPADTKGTGEVEGWVEPEVERRMLMGIQAHDRGLAQRAVADLRVRLHQHQHPHRLDDPTVDPDR